LRDEKGGADFALHGSAIEAAANLRRAPRVMAAMRASVSRGAHVGEAQSAKIDHRTGTLGVTLTRVPPSIMSAFHADATARSFHL